MKKLACAAAGLILLAATLGVAADLTVKEVMDKAHKGGNSLLANLGKDLKADEPEWADIQKNSKELVDLGMALTKADPPRGDKDSWDKLTRQYVDTARSLEAAAEKKDRGGAKAAQGRLATSCMTCHKAHRVK